MPKAPCGHRHSAARYLVDLVAAPRPARKDRHFLGAPWRRREGTGISRDPGGVRGKGGAVLTGPMAWGRDGVARGRCGRAEKGQAPRTHPGLGGGAAKAVRDPCRRETWAWQLGSPAGRETGTGTGISGCDGLSGGPLPIVTAASSGSFRQLPSLRAPATPPFSSRSQWTSLKRAEVDLPNRALTPIHVRAREGGATK